MSHQKFAVEDAKEMIEILQKANCMSRYDRISHEILSELLVSIATDGEVIGGNNRGSDVRSPQYGLIEVKSRILGTDGPFPRISLKQKNLDKASWFAAVRWTQDFILYDAVLLPRDSVLKLFNDKRQANNTAHIAWKDWINDPKAQSIRSNCLVAMVG